MTLATFSRWYPRLFLAVVILFSAVAPRPGPVSAAPTVQSSGMTVLRSTYLASGGDDKMHGIAVGLDDSLYLTGLASSGRGFPETRANQGSCTGDSCMYATFVARIAKELGAFHFSTLFGEIDDSASSRGDIAVDLAGMPISRNDEIRHLPDHQPHSPDDPDQQNSL